MAYDMLSFLKDHRIDYRTRGKGISQGWVGINCPFPHGSYRDVDYFLGIEQTTGKCSCWSCGSLKPVEVVSKILNISIPEAFIVLKEYNKGKVYAEYDTISTVSEVTLPPKIPFNPVELEYLKSRNITNENIETYKLQSGGFFGFFAYRIIIPIYQNNRLVSATSRTVVNNDVRYLTMPAQLEVVPHKHTLYAKDFIPGNKVVVVEGPIDAIRGGPGFISTYGTEITSEQIMLLTKYDEVCILGDDDYAGKKAARRLADQLSILSGTVVYSVTHDHTGKDTASLPDEAIKELRQELL
jgi:DNA primase